MVENRQWSAPSLGQAVEIAQGILPREFQSWDEVPGRSRLLPTARSSSGMNDQGESIHRRVAARVQRGDRVHTARLEESVALLPTPRAQDGPHGGPGQTNSRGQPDSLPAIARLLPTPTCSDLYTGNLASTQQKPGSMHSVTLPQAVERLLPTATAQAAKHGSTPDVTANAFGYNLWDLPSILGESSDLPSPDGNGSSDGQLPPPLWTDD
jgi:hypothetical protein